MRFASNEAATAPSPPAWPHTPLHPPTLLEPPMAQLASNEAHDPAATSCLPAACLLMRFASNEAVTALSPPAGPIPHYTLLHHWSLQWPSLPPTRPMTLLPPPASLLPASCSHDSPPMRLLLRRHLLLGPVPCYTLLHSVSKSGPVRFLLPFLEKPDPDRSLYFHQIGQPDQNRCGPVASIHWRKCDWLPTGPSKDRSTTGCNQLRPM